MMLDCRRDGMVACRSEDQAGVDQSLLAPHMLCVKSIMDLDYAHRAMHEFARLRLFD